MADPARIVERIRAQGANVVLDGDRLRVIHREKLTAEAIAFIRENGKALAGFLVGEGAFDERAAILEFDGRMPRAWAEQFADILIRKRPAGVSDLDWGWFIGRCGQIVNEAPAPEGASW